MIHFIKTNQELFELPDSDFKRTYKYWRGWYTGGWEYEMHTEVYFKDFD